MSHANESCASSTAATDDTVSRSPSRNAPRPRAGPPTHPERGRGGDADDHLPRALEPDQRRPDRHPAHVALGAVDRVDDPAVLERRRRSRRRRVPNSSPSTRWSVECREPFADRPLDRLVGLTHRGQVGLRRDLQIVRAEPVHRDAVGQIGQLQCELQGLDGVHAASIRKGDERADEDGMDGMVGVVARRDDVMAQICELVRASDPAGADAFVRDVLRAARRRRPRNLDDRRARGVRAGTLAIRRAARARRSARPRATRRRTATPRSTS